MGAIIGILILVLDIIALVDALKSSMDTGKKALWIILILVLPVVGMVLYFLIGKKQYNELLVFSFRRFLSATLDYPSYSRMSKASSTDNLIHLIQISRRLHKCQNCYLMT